LLIDTFFPINCQQLRPQLLLHLRFLLVLLLVFLSSKQCCCCQLLPLPP
jgi:hypothetical protein